MEGLTNMKGKEENKKYLKIEYLPDQFVEKFNMHFNQHITIIGNIKGLRYLIEIVKDFLSNVDNGSKEYNFSFRKELSDDSLGFRIVLIDTVEPRSEDDFKLKLTYSLNEGDEPLDLQKKPYVTLIGDKSGLEYFICRIKNYLDRDVYTFDNLNFDIGPDLDDDSIDMDVMYDEID